MARGVRPTGRTRGTLLALPATAFLVIVFAFPLVFLLILSFRPTNEYNETLDGFTLDQYVAIFTRDYMSSALLNSLQIAAFTTVACAVLAYPVAWILARSNASVLRTVTFLIVVSPLLTSVVVRSYGWRVILSANGPLNSTLMALGIIDEPVSMLLTQPVVLLTIIHVLLPFAIITLTTALRTIDGTLYRASESLGAGPVRTFVTVTLPLSLPGLLSGAMLVFALALGIYVTPLLVGGANQTLVGLRIYEQVMTLFNQPIGAAFSYVLLAISLVVIAAMTWISRRLEVKRG